MFIFRYLTGARQFAHTHDHRLLFHVTYITLTVFSALYFHLGFFALLIFAHMCLDYVKYREVHKFTLSKTFIAMIHESLVDISLFCTSLAFSVYVQHTAAAVAFSGFWRAEMTIFELVGMYAPRLAIMQHILCIFSNVQHYLDTLHSSVRVGWSKIDIAFLTAAIFAVALVLSAPALLSVESRVVWEVIFYELKIF